MPNENYNQQPFAPSANNKTILWFVLGFLIIAVIVAGGYLLYRNYKKESSTNTTNTLTNNGEVVNRHALTEVDRVQLGIRPEVEGEIVAKNVNGVVGDELVITNQPADTDGDRLYDSEEAGHGADPQNPDTDGDGILDGDEVLVWFSDPSKKDTDEDGFEDGVEVRGGFNPIGTGNL